MLPRIRLALEPKSAGRAHLIQKLAAACGRLGAIRAIQCCDKSRLCLGEPLSVAGAKAERSCEFSSDTGQLVSKRWFFRRVDQQQCGTRCSEPLAEPARAFSRGAESQTHHRQIGVFAQPNVCGDFEKPQSD